MMSSNHQSNEDTAKASSPSSVKKPIRKKLSSVAVKDRSLYENLLKLIQSKDTEGFCKACETETGASKSKAVITKGKDTRGVTLLGHSAAYGCLQIVQYLHKMGADINARNDYGWTALMSAAMNNQSGVVRYLLEDGSITIDAKNEFGISALMCAVYQRNFSITMMLLNAGASVAYDTSQSYYKPLGSPLMLAASVGDLEIINALLQYGAEFNVQSRLNGWTCLMHAARCPHATREVIELLLHYGADSEAKNWCGKTALDIAKERGNQDIIAMLQCRLETVIPDNSPYSTKQVFNYIKESNPNLLLSLIESEPKVVHVVDETTGDSTLIAATKLGNLLACQVLINAHVDIEAIDANEGWTALMHATNTGNKEIVQLLLSNGADPNRVVGRHPCSAHDIASRNNNTDLLRLLEKEVTMKKGVTEEKDKPLKRSMSKSKEAIGVPLPPLEKKSGGGFLARFSALLKRRPGDGQTGGNDNVPSRITTRMSTTVLHKKRSYEDTMARSHQRINQGIANATELVQPPLQEPAVFTFDAKPVDINNRSPINVARASMANVFNSSPSSDTSINPTFLQSTLSPKGFPNSQSEVRKITRLRTSSLLGKDEGSGGSIQKDSDKSAYSRKTSVFFDKEIVGGGITNFTLEEVVKEITLQQHSDGSRKASIMVDKLPPLHPTSFQDPLLASKTSNQVLQAEYERLSRSLDSMNERRVVELISGGPKSEGAAIENEAFLVTPDDSDPSSIRNRSPLSISGSNKERPSTAGLTMRRVGSVLPEIGAPSMISGTSVISNKLVAPELDRREFISAAKNRRRYLTPQNQDQKGGTL